MLLHLCCIFALGLGKRNAQLRRVIKYDNSLQSNDTLRKEVKVSPIQAMGDVTCIYPQKCSTALGGGRVASPMLGRLYPGKVQVLIFI